MASRQRTPIPGPSEELPCGTDYTTPQKKCRLQHMQTKEISYDDIAEVHQHGGAMPDTLRIGIRMRYFSVAPNENCWREWIAYTLYHAHDRLTNYWNLLMYFCYDGNSAERLRKARSIKYYGVPDAPELPDTIRDAIGDSSKHCPHEPNEESFPQFVENFIQQLAEIRSDKGLMPSIGEPFDSNFEKKLTPIYINFVRFFTHVYRRHYRALCGMGILYHFNSFFVNIVNQGLAYEIIHDADLDDPYVKTHLGKIIEEEDKRVKGGQ